MSAAIPALISLPAVALPAVLWGQGGPPLLTDDPGTPGAGRWEVNLAFTAEKTPAGRRLEAPLLDLNYGAGDRVQLKLELPWVFDLEEGDGSRNGPGNALAGVKWRFLDQDRHGLDLSLYPQVEFNLPTSSADRGIVEEGSQVILPLQIQRGFGPLSFNPEIGLVILEEEDEFLFGLAAGWEKGLAGFEVLAEIHATAETDFGRGEAVFNLGVRRPILKRFVLLASAGRGFRPSREGEPELLLYLGIRVLLGKESTP